jgi:hypothetical protein
MRELPLDQDEKDYLNSTAANPHAFALPPPNIVTHEKEEAKENKKK